MPTSEETRLSTIYIKSILQAHPFHYILFLSTHWGAGESVNIFHQPQTRV